MSLAPMLREKSTFLKNVAVNMILAQSIHTSLSSNYRASMCKVMTSMALRDDLQSGESYYIVEIRSLKRILEETGKDVPVLCIVDEVLRGNEYGGKDCRFLPGSGLSQAAQRNLLCGDT